MHVVFEPSGLDTGTLKIVAYLGEARMHPPARLVIFEKWPSLFRREYNVKIDLAKRLRHRKNVPFSIFVIQAARACSTLSGLNRE